MLFNYRGKEGRILFAKPMKMRHLEDYGIPSYIADVWEKYYSHQLMPVQEKAVKECGVLDSKAGQGVNRNNNLLVNL